MRGKFFLEMNNKLIGIPARNYLDNDKKVIGIYDRYIRYFATYNFKVVILTTNNVDALLPYLDGICLIGGGDLNPRLYNKIIAKHQHDDVLDEFEYYVISEALKLHLPILGICRGLQVLNVFFKGSLKSIPKTHIGPHPIIKRDETIEIVNSFHHECIDKLASNFTIIAKSQDFVIEEIEDKKRKIYAVQYHPEIEYNYKILAHFATFFNN